MYNKIVVRFEFDDFQDALDAFFVDLQKYYYPKNPIYTVVASNVCITSNGEDGVVSKYYCHITYQAPEVHYKQPLFVNKKPS
jgi:hypothetical protein